MNVFADDDEFLPATPRGPDLRGWAVLALAVGASLAALVAAFRH